jgi:hypothetical protein
MAEPFSKWSKLMKYAIAIGALLVANPVEARCHAIWHYPWAQKCYIAPPVRQHRFISDPMLYYVEITKPPPEQDQRTPEQITDQAEHDAAMTDQKKQLNFLLDQLRRQNDQHRAIPQNPY